MALPNYKDLVRVVIIEDNDRSITGTLGITDKRTEFLTKLIHKQFENPQTVTDMMVNISEEVLHPNELAFCIYQVASTIAREKAINSLFAEI
jgi:hypothetical protein